ncbi:MAG TPA: ATP-binding cassette domain-containing protein, partial [Spirochaetales bacterium]|nr:ATP-binding cassette domain-containing protein [Spirochaetales bacterium]
MLNVENLHVAYGGIRALKGVSLRVDEGEIVTIIGANGAGKSTLLNAISGFLKPTSGYVAFRGKPLSRRPDLIVRDGICHVPEGRLVFANLSVESNLAMGAYLRNDKKAVAADLERVYALFP